MHVNDSKRGEVTWKVIGLNRSRLVERRYEAIAGLQSIIDKYNRENVPFLKEILRLEIIEDAAPNKEFSFIKQEYLRSIHFI